MDWTKEEQEWFDAPDEVFGMSVKTLPDGSTEVYIKDGNVLADHMERCPVRLRNMLVAFSGEKSHTLLESLATARSAEKR